MQRLKQHFRIRPKTNQKVPKNSAAARLPMLMVRLPCQNWILTFQTWALTTAGDLSGVDGSCREAFSKE